MKAAIQTNCLPDRSLQAALIAIRATGCTSVEISSDSRRNHMLEIMSLPDPLRLLKDMRCVCLAGGWVDFVMDDVQRIWQQIELTKRLQAKNLRVWISNPRIKIAPRPEHYENAASTINFIAYKHKEVDFLFENHGGLLASAQLTAVFLATVGLDNVGLLLDPTNYLESGQDPVEAIHSLKRWIRHVHVKDQDSTGFRVLGEGTVPWKEIFQALKDIKYKGYCSLEHAVEPDYEQAMRASWSRMLEFMR
jgi:sugar phosphate isomerase/epimerase